LENILSKTNSLIESARKRFRYLNDKPFDSRGETVVYWMERDQRVDDNWALIVANEIAKKHNKQLAIIFNYDVEFYGLELRRFDFLVKGLKEVESKCEKLNIPFVFTSGDSEENILIQLKKFNACCLVTDQNPLKPIKKAKSKISQKIGIQFLEVDAHNIIPVWTTSDKVEFGARTIRGKINRLLEEYLTDFPIIEKHNQGKLKFTKNNFEKASAEIQFDTVVKPIAWLKSGTNAAFENLQNFIDIKLKSYGDERNDPNKKVISNLSPYFHFGQISTQRVAFIMQGLGDNDAAQVFLEEMIIRRELSDNYTFYNDDYDNFNGFHNWAKITLDIHREDKREYLYSSSEFETSSTHDPLWNAAQTELLTTGKMHGYMRMYWAKKILEWTESPEQAQDFAIYLNDKYAIDGRDPNGFTGIAWSIGGVHDRAWFERPIYGKVRYMNYNGAKRKFDIQKYILDFSTTPNS
jgi:deoxyribodipyrimidine photo-lyase